MIPPAFAGPETSAPISACPQAVSVWRGRLHRRHLQMRGWAGANDAQRGRQRLADPIQGPAPATGTGPSRSPSGQRCARRGLLWLAASRSSCMRCCEMGRSSRRQSRIDPPDRRPHRAPARGDAQEGRRWRGFCSTRSTYDRLRFQPSRPAPSLPHKEPNEHAENAGTRKRRHPEAASALTH